MKSTTSFTTALAMSMLILFGAAASIRAATFTVTNTADTGPGSLRQAVLDANAAAGADTVVFDAAVFSTPQTIAVASTIPVQPGAQITGTLTIIGPGAHLLTLNGNNTNRFFTIEAGDTFSLSGMTLAQGNRGGEFDGGAIRTAGNTTLTNIIFRQNTSNSGGAIHNSGNGTTTGILNIAGCEFRDNTTTGTNINGDGGSALESISGLVNITNSIMTGGKALGGGGAIRAAGVMNISNTTISNNTSGGAGNSDGGGAIYNTGALTLTNCIISGNAAGEDTDGGAIANQSAAKLTVISSTVTGNTATRHGGAIHESATDPGGFATIIDSTISNNISNVARTSSVARGGGINCDTGTVLSVRGSTISGNTVLLVAAPTDTSRADGGGIWSDGALTIDRSTVSGNAAETGFGGVRATHIFKETLVTNSTIVKNSAPSGGGFGKLDCNLSCTTVSIGNTVISGNAGGDLKSGGPGGADSNDAPIRSLGYNLVGTFTAGTLYTSSSTDLIGVDPKLGELRDNGGVTLTHAPQPGSPIIDKGKRLSDATTDQRGVTRPTDDPAIANASGGDGSDIGAFEIGASNGVAAKTLGNIATRLPVLTGENVLIAGIIVVGDVPKRVMIRALGPSLAASGVSGALEDPIVELYQGDTLLGENDNWRDPSGAEIESTGIAPRDDREAAIVRTLGPGAYTAIVRGKGDTTGVALVEGYDLDQRETSKLGNIATRGLVGSGDDVLIGGFIVGPSTRVVVRAIGPSLANGGVQGALQDPALELVNANGEIVRANDNWKGTQRAEIEGLGIQPSDDREATLIATLIAGNYTAVVRGVGGNTGVGLVEVYNLQ